MEYVQYEQLYGRLSNEGFLQRVKALEPDCEVSAELFRIWDGYIDCHSVEHCGNDGVFFLGGDPYCLEHTRKIVEGMEKHEALRQRVAAAQAAVEAAYKSSDDAAFEMSWAELQAAEQELDRDKYRK